MDFHTLLRRDLQFLCKRNKIPANMTNVAMADALKALEIVEGLHEYMNQSDSNATQSPTSVAKLPLNTTARTTRRKTTTKAKPQSSSQLVTRSCRSTSKSLAGEIDQENVNKNTTHELKTNNIKFEANVPKTPAARSTRKTSAATSCSSKVQETKKDELVQSVYNTRKSTRLLENCMADLTLKATDNDLKIEDLGGLPVLEYANTETHSDNEVSKCCQVDQQEKEQAFQEDDSETEKTNDNESKNALAVNSLVQVNQQETEQTMHENYSEPENINNFKEDNKIDSDAGDSETKPEEYYSGVDSNGTSFEDDSNQAVLGSDIADEEITLSEQETEQMMQENYSEPKKINNFNEDNKINSDAGDSKTKREEDNSGVDSDDTSSEADSNQAVLGSDIADEEITLSEPEGSAATPNSSSLLEKANVIKTTSLSPFAAESISTQFPRQSNSTTPLKNSGLKMVNVNSGVDSDETSSEADSNQAVLGSDTADEEITLSEPEGSAATPNSSSLLEEANVIKTTLLSPLAAESISTQFPRQSNSTTPLKNSSLKMVNMNSDVDSDGSSFEADSNQAVLGFDIADEEITLSVPEGSTTTPNSSFLEEAKVIKTTLLSPFAAESISTQFPRQSNSTNPFKNSGLKMVIVNKENNIDMMMNVNNNENGESKGEEAKKKKKVAFDEEDLKDVSMRQLTKMVKELSIKSSNRTALQVLPANNQTAE